MAETDANARTPNSEHIHEAIRIVREITWHDWKDAFEHSGSITTNPILADPVRFNRFCWKWRVGRTIRKGTHDQFRCFLRDSPEFAKAISDDTGHKLTKLEANLQARFAASKSIRSALSKVAAFVRPDRFVAWDQYARKGLNLLLGRPKSIAFKDYADYLAAFEDVWNGPLGEQIRELTREAPHQPLETEPRFQRRVLDFIS